MIRHFQTIFVALWVGTLAVLFIASGVRSIQWTKDPNTPTAAWALKPPEADAPAVDAGDKMPGIYPVGSRIEDTSAPGLFGSCSNFPFELNRRPWGTPGAIALVAFPNEPCAYAQSPRLRSACGQSNQKQSTIRRH